LSREVGNSKKSKSIFVRDLSSRQQETSDTARKEECIPTPDGKCVTHVDPLGKLTRLHMAGEGSVRGASFASSSAFSIRGKSEKVSSIRLQLMALAISHLQIG